MNHIVANSCNSRLRCSYCLCGTVMGPTGPAASVPVLFMMDCISGTVCTDENGNYCLTATAGSNVTLSVETGLGVTVTPPCYQICSVRSDFCELDFVLSSVVPEAFTVSGTITGLASVADVPVTYTVNGQSYTTTTDAFGNYAFSVPAGADVVITPSTQSGYTVVPTSYTISSISQNITGQDFIYTQAFGAYTVSGAISGRISNVGTPLTYSINGQNFTTFADALGRFTFQAPTGANIVITPSVQSGYTVFPANYQIYSLSANTSNQNFVYA